MLGAIFAVLSAATFGLNNATVRRGVITGSVFQALAITIPLGVPFFVLAAFLAGQLDEVFGFSNLAFIYFGAAGILHFIWGRYCNYRATKAMGSNLAGPVQQLNLVVALGCAMIWLGETLSLLKIAGLAFVLAGPAIMIWGRGGGGGAKAAGEPGFRPRLFEGYSFAILSASGYGFSPVLVKAGLAEADAAMAGGMVSYIAATLAFCLIFLLPGRLAHVILVDRSNARWFAVSGLFVFLAQMFRYLALSIAPVTVVTPIQRLSFVFRTLFSTLLNRDHEVLDAKVLIGMTVSLLGAVALSISIDSAAAFFGLPPWLVSWHWP
jgi:uncharacterized membrane protein